MTALAGFRDEARIVNTHTYNGCQLLAQTMSEPLDHGGGLNHVVVDGVLSSNGQADFARYVVFKQFESPGVIPPFKMIALQPADCTQVHRRGFKKIQNTVAHIHKSCAARASQVFTAAASQHVALDLIDVQHSLACGLTRIQQEQYAALLA